MAEISFAALDDFALPDRFVMVCNATGVPNANLAPIYHLGRDRIAAIAINVGVAEADFPTSDELANAVRPAEWLKLFAVNELGLGFDRIMTFTGDPDCLSDWASTDADSAVGWAAQFGLPIVANLQGGTTQMSIGLMQALLDSDVPWLRCFLGKQPPLTYLPVRAGDELVDLRLPQPAETAPLDVLLDARGLVRNADEAQVARNAFMAENAPAAAALFDRHWRAHRNDETRFAVSGARSAVNRALSDRDGRGRKREFLYPFTLPDAKAVAPFYAQPLGTELWNGGVVRNDAHRAFLAGGWLEQVLTDKLRRWIGNTPGWRVEPNLSFALKGGMDTMNEVDILLMQHELCHVIEVKSGWDLTGLQDWGNKLATLRRLLSGRPGRAWIVAPFAWIDNAGAREEQIERLREKDVRLFLGYDALLELESELMKLVDER